MGARQSSGPAPARTQPNRLGLLVAAVAFVLFVGVGRAGGGWLLGPADPGSVPTPPTVVAPTATPPPPPPPSPAAVA